MLESSGNINNIIQIKENLKKIIEKSKFLKDCL